MRSILFVAIMIIANNIRCYAQHRNLEIKNDLKQLNVSINLDYISTAREGKEVQLEPAKERSLKEDLAIAVHRFKRATKENVEEKKSNQTEECVGDVEFCNLSREEYVTMLNEYIYPQTYEWVLIATHTAVFVIGLVGNALVCVAVYRNHSMHTVTNYFLVNLAVADFMVILFCLPATVLWDVTETWFLGAALCKILLYFQVIFFIIYSWHTIIKKSKHFGIFV